MWINYEASEVTLNQFFIKQSLGKKRTELNKFVTPLSVYNLKLINSE